MKRKAKLVKLMEECGEAIQAASKCFHNGFDKTHKDGSNEERLCTELGDILAWIVLCKLDTDLIEGAMHRKLKQLREKGLISKEEYRDAFKSK